MTRHESRNPHRIIRRQLLAPAFTVVAVIGLSFFSGTASAQELRYSWMDLSYMAQDVDRMGTQEPILGQTVDVDAKDGSGVRFRASFGTWNNLFAYMDYSSTDIDVDAVVTNAQGVFPASDEFDLTTIRGGVGLRFAIGFNTHIYGLLTYDSLDFDFGSFAGENFDTDDQDVGGTIGFRTLLGDDFELRAHARYSNHADVDLTTGEFDTGEAYGLGFGWQIVRGFSIVGDFESGAFDHYSIGFRLDLDED